jgi:hypothetical protein
LKRKTEKRHKDGAKTDSREPSRKSSSCELHILRL